MNKQHFWCFFCCDVMGKGELFRVENRNLNFAMWMSLVCSHWFTNAESWLVNSNFRRDGGMQGPLNRPLCKLKRRNNVRKRTLKGLFNLLLLLLTSFIVSKFKILTKCLEHFYILKSSAKGITSFSFSWDGNFLLSVKFYPSSFHSFFEHFIK